MHVHVRRLLDIKVALSGHDITWRTNVKIRAVCLIDYEIEGSFKEAAEEQSRLEEAIKSIVENNPRVVHHQVDLKERRGSPPDITKMKFRST